MAWTTRTIGLTALGIAMIGGLAYVSLREDPVPVDLITVAEAPMQVTIDADGKTRIRNLYEVASPISGTALRAPVAVGQRVTAGETVVARVEPLSPSLLDARSRAQAEAAVAEARAALDVARTELTRAEEEAEFIDTQFARVQALVERGVATVTQLEDATQKGIMADSAVAEARSRVIQAEGTLERSQAALLGPDGDTRAAECCTELRAPADGVVLTIPTISEHPVQPGSPLVSIGDPADLEIVADILSADAVRIGPGTRAIVERWGGPDPLEAELVRIDPAAETRVSALGIEEQRVDVIFDITSPAAERAGLGHGFSVFLRVIEWEDPSALQVPIGAIFRHGDGWAVFAVVNDVAEVREVQLGRRGTRSVQILGGVEAGDVIVTHPSSSVADGVRVVDRATVE